ncbi:MAG: hypothetical protein ACREPA_12810, partial [Candidatus Dormibacteraceae bacterium]
MRAARGAGLGGAILVLLALASCGTPGRPEVGSDQRLVAAAVQSAEDEGVRFAMTEKLVLTGGSIHAGTAETVDASADGTARHGDVKMTYRLSASPGGGPEDFQILIVDSQLYLRGAQGRWKTAPATVANALYAGLRLDLVREAVLLARSTRAGATAHLPGGAARAYHISPGPDQVEQLGSGSVPGDRHAAFLSSAGAEVDAFLSVSGARLVRIEIHLHGTDPQIGIAQRI